MQNEEPPKDAEEGERGIPSPFPAHSSSISTRRRRAALIPSSLLFQISLPRAVKVGRAAEVPPAGLALPCPQVGFSQLRRLGQGLGC